MDILRLVDDLEDIVETSNTIPLTGKVMVEKEEILSIIEQLRHELPLEITEATQIRNEKELSIRELSELSGVPKRTIEDIERFDRCKVDTAIKLADALGVTLDELCR